MSEMNGSMDSQFEFVRSLSTQGANNAGMFLAKDLKTNKEVVLKRLAGHQGENEVAMHRRLLNHPNIVQMVHFAPPVSNAQLTTLPVPLDEQSDFYIKSNQYERLYLETCYAMVGGNQVTTLREVQRSFKQRGLMIPELFIWTIYADILKAVCFMWFGVRDVENAVSPEEGWEPILHRDVHDENIFLASREPDSNSTDESESATDEQSSSDPAEASTPLPTEYPRVVLGDFGNSTPLSELPSDEEGTRDLSQLDQVMEELCYNLEGDHLYSQELADALKPLGKLRRMVKGKPDPELLIHTKRVIEKMEKLRDRGVLVFEPL